MTASELISTNVATGLADERLSDVAARIAASGSHVCVVLGDDCQTFIGVVRFSDVAERSNPGNRILGDLVGGIEPMTVSSVEPAMRVAALFVQHGLTEAIVLDSEKRYVGLITTDSVLAWTVKQLQVNAKAAELITGPTVLPPDLSQRGPREQRKSPRSKLRVLLVEDHPSSRQALVSILRRRNYDVIETGTVAEAISLAAKQKFDLVVSDIELPDGSGWTHDGTEATVWIERYRDFRALNGS